MAEMVHQTVFAPECSSSSGSNGRNNSSSYVLVILNSKLPRRTPDLWKLAQVHLCADGGANRLYRGMPSPERYIPEYIIGDLDSIEPEVKDFYASKATKILDKSHDQDTTDLHKCITYIKESMPTDNLKILVLGALGGRFDHEMGNLNVLYGFPGLRILLLNDENLLFLLPRGYHHELRVKPGVHCGLLPIGEPSKSSSTTGLRWNLNSTAMSFGSLVSTSNITEEEIVTVRSDVDLVWTMEMM